MKDETAEEQFHLVCNEGAFNVVNLLKDCARQKDLLRGSKLHAYIWKHKLLENDSYVASSLVSMYAKCGATAKAQQVHNEIPFRDVVTWTALIAGYAQQGQGKEALKCLENMEREGHCPNAVTFTCALKACGSTGAVADGEKIHKRISSLGLLEKDLVLGNALVDMYARCSALPKAQQVLIKLPVRNVVTWNALIAGYVQQGQGEAALKCFDSMQCECHSPDVVTFICALKACGIIRAMAQGERIHDRIVSLGVLEKDIVVGSTLVDMYARCGALPKAQQVLEELPVRNVVTWNALITGYLKEGQAGEAVKCFNNMQREGHSPNFVSFTCALKACANIGLATEGEKIHDKLASLGMLEKDIALGNSLVDMYASCGALAKAQQVLNNLPLRDVVTWNALIAGYVQHGQGEEALKCFNIMCREGYFPDMFTFTTALKACGIIGSAAKGEKIHKKILSLGMLEKDIVLGNTLVDMYTRCGALRKAQEVLQELPVLDAVTWTTLIQGFTQHGQGEEALKCFNSMQCEGYSPNVVTFTCALKACGSIGAASKGEQIHGKIMNVSMLEKNIVLGNTLVSMYAKCAALAKAVEVIEKLLVHDVVTWNALIGGYAQQGQSGEALNCFERMQSKGIKPNAGTLVRVLHACSHSGLLDQAEMYFSRMNTKYSIAPGVEHYCCLVDLLGRAGQFEKALLVIEKVPSEEYLPMWHALMGACCTWADVKIGSFAFQHALHLDKGDAATYVSMANIYRAAGIRQDADNIDVWEVINDASMTSGYCSYWRNV